MKIIEITKDNWLEYKERMLKLEDYVKADMVQKGIGNLFFTTGEDIKDYAEDPRHHVYVMKDENENLVSQVYIIGASSHIQGDYSDLPKYFTMDEGFQTYLKQNVYKDEEKYITVKSKFYTHKISAFTYAIEQIYGSLDIVKFNQDLDTEINSETHFDERTTLRRDLNRYMSEYMKKIGASELYRQFYWVKASDLKDVIQDEITDSYDKYLEVSKINVYGNYVQDMTPYYAANVDNTIELDTYITNPNFRQKGAAKILSFVGLSKTIEEFFQNSDSDNLYLSITLHKDNYLSENVAHFFGFEDYIDLERRSGIDRHVCMKCLNRNNYKTYLEQLSKKLSYFYDFGNQNLSDEEIQNFETEKATHNATVASKISYRLETEDDIDESTKNFWQIITLNKKHSKTKVIS